MKPRAHKLATLLLVGAWGLTSIVAAPTADKKKKKGDPATSSPPPAGSVPLPILPGRPAVNVRIPDLDMTGKILSLLQAEKATKLDDDRVKFEGLNLDFNKPDGKTDFHVILPASVMNLKTHIITSDDPVTVRTQDFELTGEKMEFNTVERQGKLEGKVRMVIHNLKQLAGSQAPTSE